MTAAEAVLFTRDSVDRDAYMHITSEANVPTLLRRGFDLSRSPTTGRQFGPGVYVLNDADAQGLYELYVRRSGGKPVRLEIRINVRSPLVYRETTPGEALDLRNVLAGNPSLLDWYDSRIFVEHLRDWYVRMSGPYRDQIQRSRPPMKGGVPGQVLYAQLHSKQLGEQLEYMRKAREQGILARPREEVFTQALQEQGYDCLVIIPKAKAGSATWELIGGKQVVIYDPQKVVIVHG